MGYRVGAADPVVGVFGLEIGLAPSDAPLRVFSKVESRDAMSAMMAFLVRRTRGPGVGYAHGLLVLVQCEQGRFLSHRIFLWLQLEQDRRLEGVLSGQDGGARGASDVFPVLCVVSVVSGPTLPDVGESGENMMGPFYSMP
jgi:hypothetical protein